MQLDFFEPYKSEEHIIPADGKACISCGEFKGFECYSKHTGHKDNLDGRCRECINSQVKLRKALKKQAPPKPTICECCGKDSDDIVLDHCHINNTFRGWLCRHCNAGIGFLEDSTAGVEKALSYLRKTDGQS